MTANSVKNLDAGTQVRLVGDPGRVGVLTGRTRERAGTLNYQVSFPEGSSYQPAYELEAIDNDNSDPYVMIEGGRFGRVSDLRRNLLHIQLSGRLANLVYSMETTNTDFYAYQFKPVLSFLDSPSNGLLIADEVGLGKTIEAGLIWTELRARYDARRLVVVCPAMLREKWKDELRERFGVDATIVDSGELVEELKRNKQNVADGKALICSIQGLRPPRHWDEDETPTSSRGVLAKLLTELASSEPIIDLLIVDEAHYLRNPGSQTAKLGIMLRDVSEHIVLLSATPVNLKEEDLFHLLKLVDPDSFAVKEYFPQVLEANRPLLQARELTLNRQSNAVEIKELLSDALTHEPLKNSLQLKKLIEEDISESSLKSDAERVLLANRIEKVNLLRHAVSRTRKVEVTEWKVVREPFTELVKLNQTEIDFYNDVTEVVQEFASSSNVSAGFLLASPQRQISSCMYAAFEAWKQKIGIDKEQIYEDLGIDTDGPTDISPLIDQLVRTVLPKHDSKLLRLHDSKFGRFEHIVLQYLEENENEKIVVFSYFRKTLDYLSERLSEKGIKNQVLVGGMARPKQEIINEFRQDPSIKVLLSSEVASEGVDLQFSRFLVNYDLPWNPMKIEQRIGRLDRIGQKADKVNIWNLCYENTIDQRILERLFVRLDIFKHALGGLEAILGEKIEKLSNDILSSGLSSDQIDRRIEATALAIERTRQDEKELENEASHLIAHQGYILEQVHAAHDYSKRITEDDLVLYVKDYLNKYCQGNTFQRLKTEDLIFNIRLPSEAAVSLGEFVSKKHLQGQTSLATGIEVECEFVNKVPVGKHRKEFVSQFHPLIRFISDDLRRRNEAFYPMVAAKIPQLGSSDIPIGPYAFVIDLWAFEGLRVEEEIRAHIFSLDGETSIVSDSAWDLISRIRTEGQDWLAAPNELDNHKLVESIDQCASSLQKLYSKAKLEKELENKDRVSFQVQSAQRHRDRHLETHTRVLEGLCAKGHMGLVSAREGLIKKVKERFEIQEESLRRKGKLKSSSFEICFGAILVE